MAKQPPTKELHSWSVYHLTGTPAKFIGIVDNQPDAESAIEAAIRQYDVPQNLRSKMIAQRWD